MEVKSGYKMTEVGMIPDEWKIVFACNIGKFFGGSGFPIVLQKNTIGDYPFFKVSDMNAQENKILMKTATNYITEAVRAYLGANLIPAKSIIFAKVGAAIFLERKKILNQPSCLDNNMAAFFISDNKVHYQFIYFVFQSIRLSNFTSTTALPSLNKTILNRIKILLPPTAEQKAIADALNDADALIESLEQLIHKKRQLKQGAMQVLLHPKEKWKSCKIGDLLKIMHGKSQHLVADQNGIYPILATGGQIGTANTFLYDKPSVLIGRKGTIDKPQFMDKPFWTVDTLFYSIVYEPNNPKYLFYQFCLIDWRKFNEASGVPSLNAKTIEQIELKVPTPMEQNTIAALLTDIDSEISVLENKLEKAKQIKQGMMHNLLTGRIRLV